MALAHRWASRNLTRLELCVMIGVLLLLAGTFLRHVQQTFDAAELRSVQTTVINMNSALRVLFYRHVVAGRQPELAQWRGANPVAVLDTWNEEMDIDTLKQFPALARFGSVPGGLGDAYIGELDGADPAGLPTAHWYFDRVTSQLVYRGRKRGLFDLDRSGRLEARFRLDIQFHDVDADGEFDSTDEHVFGVTLKPVESDMFSAVATKS